MREAILASRKGGSVFVLGVFGALLDKFPLGAVMNKGLTLRAAQQHGQRNIPMLLDHMAADELKTEHAGTHVMPPDAAPRGQAMFKEKTRRLCPGGFRPKRARSPRPEVSPAGTGLRCKLPASHPY